MNDQEIRDFLRDRISNISTAAEDDIIALIKSREERLVKEARIDELNKFHFNWSTSFTTPPMRWLQDRIASLTKSQEKT